MKWRCDRCNTAASVVRNDYDDFIGPPKAEHLKKGAFTDCDLSVVAGVMTE